MAGRSLRLFDLVLYGVAMNIGLRWIAAAAAAGPASLPLWILALFGFMGPLVVVTAEMTGRFAGDGGIYHWTRDTLGPFPGFLVGWLYWTCNLPYFSGQVVFILGALAMAFGHNAGDLHSTTFLAGAVGVTVAVAALNWAGLGAGKWLSNLGAAATLLLLAVLLAAGALLGLGHHGATPIAGASLAPPLNADGAALWATMVFAFGGPEALAFLRGDVKGGTSGVLKALAIIGVILAINYIAGTAAMLAILRPADVSRLSGIPEALAAGLGRFGLSSLAPAAMILLALSMLGGFSAWFGVAARLPFVVGADRYLPAAFGHRDARTGAPVVSIVCQALAVIALIALGVAGASIKAAYDFLVSMTVLSYVLPFVFLFIAYVRVQSVRPPAGEWRVWGGARSARIIGAVGLVVTLSAIACTLVPSPDASDKAAAVFKLVAATAVLVGGGVIAYLWGRARAAAKVANAA